MDNQKTAIAVFAVGTVLLALGILGIPFNEILLIIGSALASFAYALVLLQIKYGPTIAPTPGAAATTTLGPSIPSTPQATPSMPGQPQPPQVTPPTAKAPKLKLPQTVTENLLPIALLALGVTLVFVALYVLIGFPGALGYGLLIPGALFLAIGGAVLFLRLYRKEGPVVLELRRFCMHCGFQMSSTDVSCPRCRRQPPSGVDTKICPNCAAVIPNQAKFCRDCGAGQPTAPQ